MIENPELKLDIETFAIEMLEGCELFVKTYGKGYAKERLAINFKSLYTEGSNNAARGQYNLTSGKMALFFKGTDGKLLTFQDLERNANICTALHESIHAIFNKTPEECADMGIKYGSGIHEKYDNGVELGRGLNEGFTNWVCEKAGLNPNSYIALTNFVRMLELAIGPESVMKFGEGDIVSKIPQLLEMTPEECWQFLGKTDTLYDYEYKLRDYESLSNILKRKYDFDKESAEGIKHDEYQIERMSQDLKKIKDNPIYINILQNTNYIEYAQEKNLDPESEETKIAYFTELKNFYSKKSKEIEQELQAEIFSRYFAKELETLLNNENVSLEQYKKITMLSNLMYTYGKTENETLKYFQESFETLKQEFFRKAHKDLNTSIEEGTLTTEQILEYREVLINGNSKDLREFDEMFSKLMLPESPEIYKSYLNALSRQNMISNTFDYKLLELQTPSGQKTELFFDTKNNNHFSRYIELPKIFRADQEIEDTDNIIDITLTDLQSTQEIVKSFLALKEQINQKNPKAKIQIVERVIISTVEGEEPSYYMIEGNEIVLAEQKELIPRNARPKEERRNEHLENNNIIPHLQVEELHIKNNDEIQLENNIVNNANPLKPIFQNPIKRFFLELKKRFAKKEPAIAIADASDNKETHTNITDDAKKFNDRIRVNDANNQQIPTQNTHNIKQSEKTDKEELIQ